MWFESLLRNEDATPWLGETGVIRFAVGILCLYVLLVVVEQQRMGAAFKGVLLAFKRFSDSRGGEVRSGKGALDGGGALASLPPLPSRRVRSRCMK